MIVALGALALASPPDYVALRRARAERLLAPKGWFSVAGLDWLKEGDNPAPRGAGILRRKGQTVTLVAARPDVTVDSAPVTERELRLDADEVRVGDVRFTVIARGDRIGVRTWDPNKPARKAFRGLRWFPADPRYRIAARFVPYPRPRQIPILNILGDTSMVPSSGYVRFTLNGRPCRLEAQDTDDGLFFNFTDATSGGKTYPAGRFLDSGKPVNGWVTLDFNLAVNPPCAYTEFATCPLPPKGNRLPVAVRAGEKTYPLPH